MQSYEMIEDRMKEHYLRFYDATYKECHALDLKTKELIAIAAALVAQCQGCVKGHIKKAINLGATRQEISEAICIAVGINAAAVVDQTDIANFEVDFITMLEEAEAGKPQNGRKSSKKTSKSKK
jgi:AhpD family alkylhydroperoxidase